MDRQLYMSGKCNTLLDKVSW